MEWIQVLTIVGANFAMLLWSMRERRADFHYVMKVTDEIRKEIATFKADVQSEMKDFHGRLCAIEEKNKGK